MSTQSSSLKINYLYKKIFNLLIKSNNFFSLLKNNQTSIISYTKNKSDRLTNFDWSIQKLFQVNFEKDFPFFDFFFEEDYTSVSENEKLPDCEKYYSLNPNDFSFINELIDEKDDVLYGEKDKFCLYLDPLDGTWGFINKDFKSVSTIIGVTLNDVPLFGFIHSPMYSQSGYEFTSKTVFSIRNQGVFEVVIKENYYEISKLNDNLTCFPEKNKNLSVFFPNLTTNHILSSLKNQVLLKNHSVQTDNLNGYGNILSHFITNNTDLMYVPYKRLGYWDMCGPNAILNEYGGGIVYLKGEKIEFPSEENRKEQKFREGISEFTICYKKKSDLKVLLTSANS